MPTLPGRRLLLLLSFLFVFPKIALAQTQIPAFPGCQGFGCETPGGRGGIVVVVTNLNDSGPGSLREALMMTEPRIIVFKVSGTIYLNSPLWLGEPNSYVTVAGETAPGDGIAIAPVAGAEAWLGTGGIQYEGEGRFPGGGDFHDGVFRYLRFRSGRGGTSTSDQYRFSISLWGGTYRVVVDHNSFTWSNDQIVNQGWGGNTRDITWSWNIIGEGGGQNAGSFMGGGSNNERTSVHHNYIAHSFFRNYLVPDGEWDFTNEVHYNTDWNYHLGESSNPDIISNYFKRGPTYGGQLPVEANGAGAPVSLYLAGNKLVDIDENIIGSENGWWNMVGMRNGGQFAKRLQPHTYTAQELPYPVIIQSADAAKNAVLAKAGPRPLDSVDTRLLGNFYDGGGYSLSNVGDFDNYSLSPANLQPYTVPQDSDNDGMPNDWEVAHGLNPNNPADNVQDRDGDGYTNIEEWINSIGAGDDGTGNGNGATPTKKPTVTPIPTPTPLLGDLDKDGDVDIFDYNILVENFGKTGCGNVADIDGNCKVDIFDYNTLIENFGKKG